MLLAWTLLIMLNVIKLENLILILFHLDVGSLEYVNGIMGYGLVIKFLIYFERQSAFFFYI